MNPAMKNKPASVSLSGALPDLQSIGISVWDPIYAQRDHIGPHWEVVHIVNGSFKLHLDGQLFLGREGDTLIVPAQAPHRDEFPLNSDFQVLHFLFLWADAPTLFPIPINRDLVALPRADKHAARMLAFEAYDCFRRHRCLWKELTRAAFYRLLLFLRSAATERCGTRPPSEAAAARERYRVMIQNVKEFIQANLARPIALADIAAHLGISAYHLSHVFSEESGFTLSSYLAQSRMELAAERLSSPRAQVAEVAYSVGFEDPNYFGKAFRRHFGCTPGQYRARRLKLK